MWPSRSCARSRPHPDAGLPRRRSPWRISPRMRGEMVSWKGCKPNSVFLTCARERVISLSDRYPEPDRLAPIRCGPHRRFPIWSCSRGGLPCPASCVASGGLLNRLFTLTRTFRPGRYLLCGTVCRSCLSTWPPACISGLTGVTRPRALWSSDFPPATAAASDPPPFQDACKVGDGNGSGESAVSPSGVGDDPSESRGVAPSGPPLAKTDRLRTEMVAARRLLWITFPQATRS
ncbi:MAG: hypothetical protein RIT19_1388 [Verrucomicrobiota bacterium]|jgi:hypothetical protein